MIRDLKPYPAYRDSGVPWLGKMPAHWQVERLKARVADINELARERRDNDLRIALEHVEGWTGRLREAGTEEVFDSQLKRFHAGDVLFGKLRPYLAKVTRPDRGGVCVGEFLVLRPRGAHLHGTYLAYLLRAKSIVDVISSSVFGARMPRADWQFIGSMWLSVPPIAEQSPIVRFLDHLDRRIRRCIRAKQKLITLLNEQRQAIIHRAVTRGLAPNVRLKPSGVEWLGDVPEHWRVLRVKDMAQLRSGDSITSLTISDTGRYPVYGGNNVRGFTSAYTHEGEFVLIGRQGALCGNINYARGQFWASEHAVVAHPRQSYDLIWFGELLRIMNLNQYSMSAAQPGLSVERIQNLQLPVPPADEQLRIAHYLESAIAGPRCAVAFAQREISLLREFRTRLIADVVTGKLDVREAAAHLPEETGEPEPLDDTDTSPEDISEETETTDPDATPTEAEA